MAKVPSPAQVPAAEPGVTTLPNVSVRAQRDPDKSTPTQPDVRTARERIQRTPGGAAVVDADDYTQGRVSTLSDALGMATGVFVQPRFGAEESRISIRGSGLQRTAHGRGLKLMQDGVPLNLADGSFDFQAVEALTARYVEVWRGANALQYGSSTLGGAVNFVSPNGYNADKARVRLEGGSHGYARALLSAGTVLSDVDLYVSTSAFVQDGFRAHAQQDTRRNFANLGWQLILRKPGAGTRMACDAHFKERGFMPRVRLELGSNEAIKQSVAAGIGLSVLSRHALAADPADDGLVVLPAQHFPVRSSWSILFPHGRRLSPIAAEFLRHLTEAAKGWVPHV